MADYGVTYEPPNPATFSLAQNSDNDANIERRYGVIDASDARVRGYALPGGPGGSAPESRKLTDDQRLVLKNFDPTTGKARAASFHGKALPKGGCRLQAANQMGDLRSKTAEQINGDTFSQSREHATVAALSRKRDACLTSKGYSPSSGKGVASEALPKEQAVAEADCSTKVGIADQWFSIESQMQSDSIAKNKAALDAEKTQNDEILRKAEAVLSKA
ncbi:hypothetical protein AB0I22_36180 [Streptomyces sp. NPDC050610]|uniref:hypothetical protein n=1 Tax=Streptomyces sp. NPDC050610 TaxID=3157097 RepID=UPI00341CC973